MSSQSDLKIANPVYLQNNNNNNNNNHDDDDDDNTNTTTTNNNNNSNCASVSAAGRPGHKLQPEWNPLKMCWENQLFRPVETGSARNHGF